MEHRGDSAELLGKRHPSQQGGLLSSICPLAASQATFPFFLLGLSILLLLKMDFVSFLLFLSRALLNLCAAPQLVCICVQTQLVFEPKKGKLEAMSYHPLVAVLLQTLALLGN